MQEGVINILEQFGYLGLFLLIALENIFPPIPSELILPFAGFLTTYSSLTIVGVITAATLGSVIGAMILYSVGLIIDFNRLEKIINQHGNLLRLKSNDIVRVENWFTKYGPYTVFFCRMIPVVRSLISLPAGMTQMPLILFLPLTFFGTLLWNTILIYFGFLLAENWTRILNIMSYYSTVTYIIIAILLLLVGFWYTKKGKKQA